MLWSWAWEILEVLSYAVLFVAGIYAGLVGIGFNYVVLYTVIGMGWVVSNLGAGDANALVLAWTFVRDLVNILLIFGIVYTGALLVLGFHKGGYLRTIAYILIAALLVNFSLFLTKAVIEIANVAAIQLYASTVEGGEQFCKLEGLDSNSSIIARLWRCAGGGYSAAFFQELSLTQLFQDTSESKNADESKRKIVMYLGGAVFLVVLGTVLLTAAVLLVVRFLYLLFLMILSPFAFVAWAIPHLGDYWREWWQKLLGQAFFAPLLFLGLWITLLFISEMKKTFGSGSYSAAFQGDLQAFGLIFLFTIAIGLLWGSLSLAKRLADETIPEGFRKHYDRLQKYKGALLAGSLMAGALGPLGAAVAVGLGRSVPARMSARRVVGGVGKRAMDKGKELTRRWVAKGEAARARGTVGGAVQSAVYRAALVPAAHALGEIGQVLYTGKGEYEGGVLSALAKMGLKQSLSEYERDVQRLHVEAAVELAKRKPPKEIQEQADQYDAKVVAAQEGRNQIEEELEKVANGLSEEMRKPPEQRDQQKLAQLIERRDQLDRELGLAGKLQNQLASLPQELRSEFEQLFQDGRFRQLFTRAQTKWQQGLELTDAEADALGLVTRKTAYITLRSSAEKILQDPNVDQKLKEQIQQKLKEVEEKRARGESDPFYRLALEEAVAQLQNFAPHVVDQHLSAADKEWIARDAQGAFDAAVVEPYRRDAANDALRLLSAYKDNAKRWGHLFYRGEIEAEAAKQALPEIRKVAGGKLTTSEEVARLLQAMTQVAETGAVETSGPEPRATLVQTPPRQS